MISQWPAISMSIYIYMRATQRPGWEESRGGVREERAGSVRAAQPTDHYTAEHAVEHTGIQEVL